MASCFRCLFKLVPHMTIMWIIITSILYPALSGLANLNLWLGWQWTEAKFGQCENKFGSTNVRFIWQRAKHNLGRTYQTIKLCVYYFVVVFVVIVTFVLSTNPLIYTDFTSKLPHVVYFTDMYSQMGMDCIGQIFRASLIGNNNNTRCDDKNKKFELQHTYERGKAEQSMSSIKQMVENTIGYVFFHIFMCFLKLRPFIVQYSWCEQQRLGNLHKVLNC